MLKHGNFGERKTTICRTAIKSGGKNQPIYEGGFVGSWHAHN
jgi:hypothetical protein